MPCLTCTVERSWHARSSRRPIHVHGRVGGATHETSEIIEIRGPGGAPPYLVRRDDGQEALVFPGADACVEHPTNRKSI